MESHCNVIVCRLITWNLISDIFLFNSRLRKLPSVLDFFSLSCQKVISRVGTYKSTWHLFLFYSGGGVGVPSACTSWCSWVDHVFTCPRQQLTSNEVQIWCLSPLKSRQNTESHNITMIANVVVGHGIFFLTAPSIKLYPL